MTFAGTPPSITFCGTSLVTTAPAAITELSPMVTPGTIVALAPIHTFFPITTLDGCVVLLSLGLKS